jgi:XTP/dITP diphosphohydrolase
MSEVARLVEVMDQLRSPGGCPWDAEQTHESLTKYLLEETYETLDAIASGDLAELHEELGDLLLQVVFHARIAQETNPDFSLESIARGVIEKLVRRHPHVFAGVEFKSEAELEANWKRVKAQEKSRESSTDGVPLAMPALALAQALNYRTKDVAVQLVTEPVLDAARQLFAETEDLGQLLAGLAVVAGENGVEAETVLRDYLGDYRNRVRVSEGLAN